MNNGDTTMMVALSVEKDEEVRRTLRAVHAALTEKGYNPISQIVGYVLSGDPSYITSHNGARSMIGKVERDELLEVVFTDYLNQQ